MHSSVKTVPKASVQLDKHVQDECQSPQGNYTVLDPYGRCYSLPLYMIHNHSQSTVSKEFHSELGKQWEKDGPVSTCVVYKTKYGRRNIQDVERKEL
jgi:hypothetical protein